ncbi:MAG: multicopper oxidase domain-containing protein, partial [Gammaproteobacteria bacterium]|nr:multicopper oxidase domain-containing protein [Gammaproteobacteria bacterium]
MSRLSFFLISIFLLPWSVAQAVPVLYQANNLGGSAWEYTYTVNNDLPINIEEFSTYFDPALYENLVISDSPMGWDGLAVEPDSNLPDDGFSDWLTLGSPINSGDTLGGFSVTFDFIGTGTPGSQLFEILDPMTFDVLSSGSTTSVPEPGALVLLVLGLAGLFHRSLRRVCTQSVKFMRVGLAGLLALGFLLSQSLAVAAVSDLSMTDRQLVSKQRVSRTDVEYTYTLTINNSGVPLTGVVATVSSLSGNTVIQKADVVLGALGSGSTQSADTFVLRQNRRVRFDPADLVFTFMADGTVLEDQAFGLQLMEDINPDPNIVEINLEAREADVEMVPGISSTVYTYNGTVPGPLIHGTVGDTLIVHFTNNLPEPTTIHWHGLRLPADMDGSSVSQNPIQPGDSFTYKFDLKEASLFWYHPHVRTNVQVEKGLAGALLVTEKAEDIDSKIRDIKQKILVVDDVLLDAEGQVEAAFTGTPKEQLLKKINGREGNQLLVNGVKMPTMKVKSGEPIRWRMVNIANTRFMRIAVPNHKLTRIGGDGGLLETPITNLDDVLMVSGQRADIMFVPEGEVGSELIVYWKDTARGRHSIDIMPNNMVVMGDDEMDGSYPDIPLMRLVFEENKQQAETLDLPASLRTIEPIDITNATETTLKFGHSMPMVMNGKGMVKFLINGKTFGEVT